MIRKVCVFCGSRDGAAPQFKAAALAVGRALAANGLGLVYGGAQNGLMGAVADGVLEGGQSVIGVIPAGLARQEFAHPRLTAAHFVSSMHERKALMAELSHAFLALPGGFGTLDELFEALSWAQLGLHHKPIALLDTAGYYAPLLKWIENGFTQGFIPERLRGVLVVASTPEAVVQQIVSSVQAIETSAEVVGPLI